MNAGINPQEPGLSPAKFARGSVRFTGLSNEAYGPVETYGRLQGAPAKPIGPQAKWALAAKG